MVRDQSIQIKPCNFKWFSANSVLCWICACNCIRETKLHVLIVTEPVVLALLIHFPLVPVNYVKNCFLALKIPLVFWCRCGVLFVHVPPPHVFQSPWCHQVNSVWSRWTDIHWQGTPIITTSLFQSFPNDISPFRLQAEKRNKRQKTPRQYQNTWTSKILL